MFVVHRGAVDVQFKEEAATKTLRKLHEGDFFGEMGLLTGEPRTATVVTEGEAEILEISHLCLKPILEANPELVESFSRIIEERRQSLDKPEDESVKTETENERSVFDSIKRFFGLKD